MALAEGARDGSRSTPNETVISLRHVVFTCLVMLCAMGFMIFPSRAEAEPAAINEHMRIIIAGADLNLAALSVTGRYTLVLLSPPSGQCGPCDQLWAQLSASTSLPIEVVKVQIDDELPRPKIFAEVRRLILSSMGLVEGSEISYPLGVTLDPNGVVVQATFGKPRIEKKIREVLGALAERNALAGASAPATLPASVAPAPGSLAPAAVALGVGAIAGGMFVVVASTVVLDQMTSIVEDPRRCDARHRCDPVGFAAATRGRQWQDINAAGWAMAGVGALMAAEAGALMLYERMTRSATVAVHARVGTSAVTLTVEGTF